MKIVFLLSLLLGCVEVYAQTTIFGKITDAKSGAALQMANAYVNNTTFGATSDKDGLYELLAPAGEIEIVFSFVGYDAHKIRVTIENEKKLRLDVKLVPLAQKLNAVNIVAAEDREWEKSFKQFRRVFLGESRIANKAVIKNRGYIDLERSKEKGKRVLKATASQTIEIQNDALGYMVYYDLKTFSSYFDRYKFSGFVHYKEMKPKNAEEAELWKQNRLVAYKGSLRHLMKAILDNRVKEEGFEMYAYNDGLRKDTRRDAMFINDLDKVIKSYNPGGFFIKGVTPGTFRIPLKKKIEVHYVFGKTPFRVYRDVEWPVGGLELSDRALVVAENGVILNTPMLFTSGYFSEARVADQLPNDYDPGKIIPAPVVEKTISAKKFNKTRLHESVYFQTDKNYYHPRDVIWMKGYMHYNAPEMADSLSNVIYTELISPDRKIIQTRIYPIDSGYVRGDFVLPDSMPSGTYYLRAYTSWMRNDSSNYFIKPLPVLGTFETLSTDYHGYKATNGKDQPEIAAEKPYYQKRAPITVKITFRDELDNAIPANLSVAVTDMHLVKPWKGEKTIMELTEAPQDTTKEKRFPIERGLSVNGQYRNLRNQPVKTRVKIIQGELEDMIEVNTDDNGIFTASGFNFHDSTEFAFGATTDNHKVQAGKVFLDRSVPPPLPENLPTVPAAIVTDSSRYHPVQAYDLGDAVILKEVLIKKTRLAEDIKPKAMNGMADRVVSGTDLRKTGNPDVLWALQSKVPGLKIQDDGKIMLGAKSTFGNNEVLITIDDIASKDPQGAAAMIQSLGFAGIERIEVFRYGSAAAFGSRGANGVIAIYTKKGQKKTKKPGYDKTTLQVEKLYGLSVPKKFISPVYTGAENPLIDVDYRSTLYWNPDVSIDPESGEATFSFYASDQETTYRVVAEGVTRAGKPIHIETTIDVGRKLQIRAPHLPVIRRDTLR